MSILPWRRSGPRLALPPKETDPTSLDDFVTRIPIARNKRLVRCAGPCDGKGEWAPSAMTLLALVVQHPDSQYGVSRTKIVLDMQEAEDLREELDQAIRALRHNRATGLGRIKPER